MPLPSFFEQAVRDCVARYPLLHDIHKAPLAYGTSGFRTLGRLLPPVAARVAFVAVLRAYWAVDHNSSPSGCSVGCMITASHNPAEDNGVKLIDVDGGMLLTSWEGVCTAAANSITGEELLQTLEEWVTRCDIVTSFNPTQLATRFPFTVLHLARDTRLSGLEIHAAVQMVLQMLCVPFMDHGILTTPQLHYLVQRANRPSTMMDVPNPSNFGPTLYIKDFLSSLARLLDAVVGSTFPKQRRQKVVVDAANGVGALALKSLLSFAQESSPPHPLTELFDITVIHHDVKNHSTLNHMCGADYTQKTRSPSDEMKKWAAACEQQRHEKTWETEKDDDEEVHYYSLDGDADRVVAFFHDRTESNMWYLLDGDRMSILYSLALRHWLGEGTLQQLDVGVVQTAYANGASTEYIQRRLGLRVYSAATGVKNLHPIAHQRDIGVYFEANGHGTVLFDTDKIASKLSASADPHVSIVLSTLPVLFSQVCGDGIADAFACEVALLALRMNFSSWCRLYTDLPSLQCKVIVPNPKIITNTPDERRAVTPPGLQEAIDAAVAAVSSTSHASARAFVRPSGTEPLVRVYAEADDMTACRRLGAEVESLVRQYCGFTTE